MVFRKYISGGTMGCLFAVLLAMRAFGRDVHTEQYVAEVGSTNDVDVVIDNAAGTASIALKVNYDASVLELLSVTNKPGTLGASFNLQYNGGDGTVEIVLTCQDALSSGTGTLATLRFFVNPGTQPGTYCELPVARRELGGQYGACVNVGPNSTNANGRVWFVSSFSADSDNDGIPDWWEITYFEGLTSADANADSDGDNMPNWKEYRAGTNPNDGRDLFKIGNCEKNDGGVGIVLYWSSVADKVYDIDRSTNLMNEFESFATNITATQPENVYTDNTAVTECPYFYRIKVK